MADKVILPLMDGRPLALSLESFKKGLQEGSELMSMGGTTEKLTPNDQKPIWLSVREVARLCNISETFLYDEIRLKHIRARPFGRAKRIHRDYVEHQTGDLMSNGNNEE